MTRPLIIAHRGRTPETAENAISSLGSLEVAGADLVELDIRLSLDRKPFVTHDAFLKHTTHARGWVRLYPSCLLRHVSLRNGDPGERLPSLRQMLAAFPPNLQPALHLKDRGALKPVLCTIAEAGDPSRTWLWLEHPDDVLRALSVLAGLHCTLLRPSGWKPENRDAYMRDARQCGAHAVSLPWGVLSVDLVNLAHQYALKVFSRLQESPRIDVNVRRGIDGIITDDPAFVATRLGATT